MKSKKIILKILFVFIITVFSSSIYILATDGFMQGADDFLNNGTSDDIFNMEAVKQSSDTLFNMFAIIGTIAVLIVGVILGIKFVTASTEEKAKIKETLTPYLISAVIIFGAFGIWSIAVNILQSAF